MSITIYNSYDPTFVLLFSYHLFYQKVVSDFIPWHLLNNLRQNLINIRAIDQCKKTIFNRNISAIPLFSVKQYTSKISCLLISYKTLYLKWPCSIIRRKYFLHLYLSDDFAKQLTDFLN